MRIRIAVVVSDEGEWYAVGSHLESEHESMARIRAQVLARTHQTIWVDAEVDGPDPSLSHAPSTAAVTGSATPADTAPRRIPRQNMSPSGGDQDR